MSRLPYVLALLLVVAGVLWLRLRPAARGAVPPGPTALAPAPVSPPGPVRQQPPPKEFVARVTAVTDGDTLRVLLGDRELTLRLHGIDAPESRRRQPFSAQAKQALSEAVFGKEVRVVTRGRDRNLRVIVVIFRGDENINARLVAEGMAWAFTRYSREFVVQEREARKLKRGLWRDPRPVPPWLWRAGPRPPTVAAPPV